MPPRELLSAAPFRMTIRSLKHIFCALVFAALAFPSTSQAQERERRVGVTVSAFFNTDAEMANAISEAVGRALTKTLKVQTVAGKQAQSKLPEAARSETCIGDSDCLMGAGRALEVDELLMLIVVGGGEELKIEATWASMDTGDTALRPAIVVPIALEEMENILMSQASTLIPGVELRKAALVETNEGVTGTGDTNLLTGTGTGGDISGRDTGRQGMSPLGKGLLIGGAATVVAWGGYGLVHRIKCGAFRTCPPEDAKSFENTDLPVDIIGGVGTAALSVGLYMLFTSGSDQENRSAMSGKMLTPTIDSSSLGMTFGGQF